MRARRKPASRRVLARAVDPVDGSSLAILRIALGGVGLLSAARILAYGWIDTLYAGPSHRFTYLGFGWVPRPTAGPMHGLVGLLAVASLGLLVGWHSRVAAAGVLVSLGWIELIDATTYLNHYWFLTLVAALAVAAPLGRALSADARRAGGPRTVARGWVWLFRFQVGVVYAFAGLAKLQPDWLVRALPLELWLPSRSGVPVLGRLVDIDGVPHAFAVAGAAFDCLIVPLLPLRHLAYPGDHRWTGQGYRFAWNVLLVEKAGSVTFLVHEPSTGRTWVADPSGLYTRTQQRVMASEPDLIHQAAIAIRELERTRGHEVEVRVDAFVSLNGRPASRSIDPTVDLAAEPRDPWSDDWILPARPLGSDSKPP